MRRGAIVKMVFVLLLLVNTVVLWSMRRPKVVHVDTSETRIRKIIDWEVLPKVQLTESLDKLKAVVNSYSNDHCGDLPDSPLLSFNQLSSGQKDDLYAALLSLLKCYVKSDGAAVVEYMAGRNERLAPKFAELLGGLLVERQVVTTDELKTLSSREFVSRIWESEQCKSRWEAIVENGGCINLWHCEESDPKKLNPLGKAERSAFNSTAVFAHLFAPELTFENACSQSGKILMADIKLLVEHDQDMNHERSPYYLRFWFCEDDKKWHPLQMLRVGTAGGNPQSKSKILF